LQFVEQPVEQLYLTGARFVDRRQWPEAVQTFQEVERQFPFSEWARRGQIMLAYSHYRAKEYEEAIAAAQNFISLYPGNPSAAYAYYLIGICNFDQILDVSRDQASTAAALRAFNDVIQRFPETAYARDSQVKLDLARDQLAGREMAVGRFYLRSGQTLSAINRFKTVIDVFETTTHTEEALHRLVEAYLTLGVRDEANRIAAVLGYNYPDGAWYERSYGLVTGESNAILPPPGSKKSGFFKRAFGWIF